MILLGSGADMLTLALLTQVLLLRFWVVASAIERVQMTCRRIPAILQCVCVGLVRG